MTNNSFFERFYEMHGEMKRGALHLSTKTPWHLKMDDVKIFKGQTKIETPLDFKWYSGTKATDFATTGLVILRLVTDKVISILQQNHFTGWDTFPVEVYGKDKKQIEGYHGLAVTGKCGQIDKSKSEAKKKMTPAGHYVMDVKVGLYFDPSTWDGSDIFSPEGTGYIFVTEKVKEVFEKEKVTNVMFRKITEVELP